MQAGDFYKNRFDRNHSQDLTGQEYLRRQSDSQSSYRKRMALGFLLILIVIPAVIALGITVFRDRNIYLIALCIILLSMLPFVLLFEQRRPQARELVIIAVMAAIAVAGRAAFFMIPQFKPVTAIVIIAGISLGAEAGFLTGALSGFVSNFFFGQGPWTPWQMFAWGLVGFLAGVIFHRRCTGGVPKRICVCIYGGIATLIGYGMLMDTASLLMYSQEVTAASLTAIYVSGLPFNLIHAASTVIFLYLLYQPMTKKLARVKLKYGLLQ